MPTSGCNIEGEKYDPCKMSTSVIGSIGANTPFVPVTHDGVNAASVRMNE